MLLIMFESITLSDSKKVFSHRLRNQSGISFHRIGFGEMPLEEDFQLMNPDKIRRVSYDRGEKGAIPLISSQLSVTIIGSCDIDRLQSQSIFLNPHEWSDLELPLRIRHTGRHGNIKTDGNKTGSFCHVSESGGYL